MQQPAVTSNSKLCKRCGQTKPAAEFYYCAKSADSLQTYCKDCMRIMSREHRAKHLYKNSVVLNPALADFQSRELIAELKARGYSGELLFTQKVKV